MPGPLPEEGYSSPLFTPPTAIASGPPAGSKTDPHLKAFTLPDANTGNAPAARIACEHGGREAVGWVKASVCLSTGEYNTE